MKRLLSRLIVAAICAVMVVGVLGIEATPSQAQVNWLVSFFNNTTLSGTPVAGGSFAGSVNYNWPGVPVITGINTASVPADNFSVRFETTAFFSAGTYTFNLTYDDGARLSINGLEVFSDWNAGPSRTRNIVQTFTTDGNRTVRVEMFDQGFEAVISANWVAGMIGPTATPIPSGPPWYGEFFTTMDLSGAPVFSATYPASGLNVNWGLGSPGGTVPIDNFTARFTRTLVVPTDMAKGEYTFYAKADDNFRFYVDQTLILDHWDTFAGGGIVQAPVTLLDGPHTFKFEYRELSADASVFLTWSPPLAQNPIVKPDGSLATPAAGVTPGVPTATPIPLIPTQTPPPVLVSGTANTTLNVRNGVGGLIYMQYPGGTNVAVTGRTADNFWAMIVIDGKVGWVEASALNMSGDFNALPITSGPGATTGTTGTTGGTTDGQGGQAPAPPAPPPPPPAQGVLGMVMGNLRIRQGPGINTPQIGLMPWGSEVAILGRSGDHWWYQVRYNGIVGWANAPWIRIVQGTFDMLPYTDGSNIPVVVTPPTDGVIVQAYGNMRIRSGPGLQYPKISKAVWGTRLRVLAVSTDGRWLKVQYGDVTGWTYAAWYRVVQGALSDVPVSDQ